VAPPLAAPATLSSELITERGRPIAAWIGGVLLTATFAGLAVAAAVGEPPATGSRVVWVLAALAVAAFWAWLFLWRGVRMGVIPRDDVLEVRGFLSTKRVAWSDIQRFEFDGFGVANAVLRGGGRVRLTGITSSQSYGHEDLGGQALLARLDEELARRR
jgi:Bacterial PH domain